MSRPGRDGDPLLERQISDAWQRLAAEAPVGSVDQAWGDFRKRAALRESTRWLSGAARMGVAAAVLVALLCFPAASLTERERVMTSGDLANAPVVLDDDSPGWSDRRAAGGLQDATGDQLATRDVLSSMPGEALWFLYSQRTRQLTVVELTPADAEASAQGVQDFGLGALPGIKAADQALPPQQTNKSGNGLGNSDR